MKFHWLHQGHQDLLLFFSGWGCDFHPFEGIESHNMDVLMVYDYKDLSNFDSILGEINKYQYINILTWSMGVRIGLFSIKKHNIRHNNLIVLNGTLEGIDDNFGIPIKIYEGTYENLSEENRERFFKRMVGTKYYNEKFKNNSPQREISEQKEELKKISIFINSFETPCIEIKKVVISSEDAIFPMENQVKAWKNRDYKQIKAYHFPFYNYSSWDEMLEEFLN